MKKILVIVPMMLVGCVGLRMDQSKGTASYYRLGGQDIQDLYAKKQESDGGLLEVSLGRAQVGGPDILKPGEWSDIIADYLGAGLAKDAMGELEIVKEILGDKGVDLDLDDIKQKIAEKLNGGSGGGNGGGIDDNQSGVDADTPGEVEVTEDWPWDDPRYHVYKENNVTENNRGLWKPKSEKDGNPVLLLPAYMSKAGVEEVTVAGTDVSDKVNIWHDRKPILANGLRLHYFMRRPVSGANIPVHVILDDGSEYHATVKSGTARQDPIGFKRTVEPDVIVIDEPITDDNDGVPASAEEALKELERQDQQDIDEALGEIEDAIGGLE